ncbi:MAG TPA: MFS transporter, partial [Steroidobacteraceae bacterium]|nr:MFS transporter [Steroidobacteraceae bacterium]
MTSSVASSVAPTGGAGLSTTGERPADLRGQLSWALFEFARSPYISLVYVFVFPPYFASVVIGDPVKGQEAWSFANTIVGVCVALLAPLLGAVSDRTGPRKPWLAAIAVTMSVSCIALWFAMPGAQGGLSVNTILLLVVILATCFQFTEVFHNAMLASIATPARIGGLSGLGIATGNLGTLTAMIVMLFGVALPAAGMTFGGLLRDTPLFGLDPATHEHSRIAGPVAGVWFLIFIIPLLLWTPDRPATGVSLGRAVREGLEQLWLTIKRARRVTNVALFLLARMLYTDAKVAILAYAGIYAAGIFGWELAELLLFAVMLAPFSISGGFIGGWLDDRLGSKRAIQISVGLTCIGMVGAVATTPSQILFLPYDASSAQPLWSFPYFQTVPEVVYLLTFALLAITITAAFCTSRTMMARIAPVSMMNQFFGLYALSGTATS